MDESKKDYCRDDPVCLMIVRYPESGRPLELYPINVQRDRLPEHLFAREAPDQEGF